MKTFFKFIFSGFLWALLCVLLFLITAGIMYRMKDSFIGSLFYTGIVKFIKEGTLKSHLITFATLIGLFTFTSWMLEIVINYLHHKFYNQIEK